MVHKSLPEIKAFLRYWMQRLKDKCDTMHVSGCSLEGYWNTICNCGADARRQAYRDKYRLKAS